MWHPWTIGLAATGFVAAAGLVALVSSSRNVRRVHGAMLLFLVAWTIVGATIVTLDDHSSAIDQAMALGLLAFVGLTGYLHARPGDPAWARLVHVVLGVVVLAWYGVLALRYSGGVGLP